MSKVRGPGVEAILGMTVMTEQKTLYPSLVAMVTPYHIWIVPVTRASKWLELILTVSIVINNSQYTIPAVRDVTIVTPQVAAFGYDSVVGLREGGRRRGWG